MRIEANKDLSRPDVISERLIDFEFSSCQLIQLFENHLLCVKFLEGRSFITVIQTLCIYIIFQIFHVENDTFLNVAFERSFDYICYYFAENPANSDQIVFVTSNCYICWLDLKTGSVSQGIYSSRYL